jgi:hypothetical protein
MCFSVFASDILHIRKALVYTASFAVQRTVIRSSRRKKMQLARSGIKSDTVMLDTNDDECFQSARLAGIFTKVTYHYAKWKSAIAKLNGRAKAHPPPPIPPIARAIMSVFMDGAKPHKRVPTATFAFRFERVRYEATGTHRIAREPRA